MFPVRPRPDVQPDHGMHRIDDDRRRAAPTDRLTHVDDEADDHDDGRTVVRLPR